MHARRSVPTSASTAVATGIVGSPRNYTVAALVWQRCCSRGLGDIGVLLCYAQALKYATADTSHCNWQPSRKHKHRCIAQARARIAPTPRKMRTSRSLRATWM
eukprot:12121145-Alexandrium_andersonii.AAC.1